MPSTFPAPVLPLASSTPLHGARGTRLIERAAAQALPEHTLMQRAGQAVARLALALAPHARTVWLACGPGNNGGDGLAAAAHLAASGRRVIVSLLGDAQNLPADALWAWQRAQSAGVAFSDAPPALTADDLAVDALLGIGASRAPSGPMAAAIHALNTSVATVLAVDLPTGLNPDFGAVGFDAVVRANHTLTLLTLKPGLFTGQGRDHSGRIWFDGLSIETAGMVEPDAWLSGADVRPMQKRLHVSHKGSFVDVAVVGGSPGMTGAAWLAARAAHAAGAGRVLVNLLGDSSESDSSRPELMVRPDWRQAEPRAFEGSTVVAGCGGGAQIHAALPRLLERSHRLILDADALNAIAGDAKLANLLQARAGRNQPTVLTPHPLEAARLLGCPTHDVQADRLNAASELARRYQAVAVLKGSGTVIASPLQKPHVNPTGNASLATAGTGDVLAGWIGGRWSARGPAADDRDWLRGAVEAALESVWVHGLAADRARATPLRALDLVEAMHHAMQAPAADGALAS